MHLVCFGDSITDCGRFFDAPPLGSGYVCMINEKLKERKNNDIVMNCGFDGFTVQRVLDIVMQNKIPSDSTCTLLVGINDIALMMNTGRSHEQKAEMMERFACTCEELILQILKSTDKLILMEPFIFPCPAEFQLWISHVRTMSGTIRKLADKYELPYLLLHDRLNALAQEKGFAAVTTDGIHLTTQGHRVIADELYKLL